MLSKNILKSNNLLRKNEKKSSTFETYTYDIVMYRGVGSKKEHLNLNIKQHTKKVMQVSMHTVKI